MSQNRRTPQTGTRSQQPTSRNAQQALSADDVSLHASPDDRDSQLDQRPDSLEPAQPANARNSRDTQASMNRNRSTYNGTAARDSMISTRSPAPPMSRTPSADRRLLRTLTVSPDQGDIDATPEPEYTRQTPRARQSTQQRAPTKQQTPARSPTARSPTASYQPSPSRATVASYKSDGGAGRQMAITLPSPAQDIQADAWQSNKSVAEANNHMLKYEIASDVTFTVGESKEEIRAHKYMLMARSPVLFKSLIKHLANNNVKIAVPDMKPGNFRDLLQYIYTDEFDIHSDNVTFMLYAAKKFQLKGLTNLSFQYLDAEMHDETVTKIMEQAHIYNESNLYEKCVRYIFANGNSVLRKPSMSELCDECVERIIKSDDLKADEEAVFEGCVIWANAECRREKKQPTDESRRKALGNLLYLIRFPVMDVTYFTQKVSLGKLLTHDETLSIFQYFHGEEQQLPNRFSRNERNKIPRKLAENTEQLMLSTTTPPSNHTLRVHRFTTTDGQWKQNGPPDAISFSVSEPIVLYGVEIYGVFSGKETYTCRIMIYDDITREEIRKNDSSIYTTSNRNTYDLYLSKPLRVPARRVFTVVIIMRGPATRKGVDGEKSHVVSGVTFEFTDSNRSSNGTDVTVGQIPGLLFNKTQ